MLLAVGCFPIRRSPCAALSPRPSRSLRLCSFLTHPPCASFGRVGQYKNARPQIAGGYVTNRLTPFGGMGEAYLVGAAGSIKEHFSARRCPEWFRLLLVDFGGRRPTTAALAGRLSHR